MYSANLIKKVKIKANFKKKKKCNIVYLKTHHLHIVQYVVRMKKKTSNGPRYKLCYPIGRIG